MKRINNKKAFVKTILITSFVIFVIIAGLVSSLSILKQDALNNHIKVASLYSESFSDQISQTIDNTETIINNFETSIKNLDDSKIVNELFFSMLKNNPHIRSINIINETNYIIKSSNEKNLAVEVNTNDFYPKAFFNKSVLQFSKVLKGRDFYEVDYSTKASILNSTSLVFLPLLKKITINKKVYRMIIAINSDYFINKFSNKFDNKENFLDVYRLDGILLFSTDKNRKVNLKTKNTLFEKAFVNNNSSGISYVNKKNYISAFKLSEYHSLAISVRLDYEHSIKSWREKRQTVIIIISSLVIICVILVLLLLLRLNKELMLQKKEIKNQKRFKIIFEKSSFLAASLKFDGTILDINTKALELLNQSYEGTIGLKIWDLYCWEKINKEYIKNEILNFDFNNPQLNEKTVELKIFTKKVNEVIIEFSLYAINVDEELELVVLAQDITKRKNEEKELRQAYIVFENTHDGIVITDENCNIINVNKSFCNSSGYSLKEVINKNPRILKSGLHNDDFYKQMWNAIIKDGFWEGELQNKNKKGELYSERLSINAIYDENKNVTNYIAVFWDTTQQKYQNRIIKEKEELLHHQTKLAAMGEMIENIAHQWRQPLSMISTIATGMEVKKEMNISSYEEEIKQLKELNHYAQYLSETINYFGNYLKEDTVLKDFQLFICLKKSKKLISSKYNDRKINIIDNTKDCTLYGVENELMQVLINILNNAKDALEINKIEKKYIFISNEIIKNKLIITIKDNAGGINKNIISRVFEPYFTTKYKSQGTGIGLYMSREIIIKKLLGDIEVKNIDYLYNNKSYKGAIFIINIPLNNTI